MKSGILSKDVISNDRDTDVISDVSLGLLACTELLLCLTAVHSATSHLHNLIFFCMCESGLTIFALKQFPASFAIPRNSYDRQDIMETGP